jgi:hypothetical protein
MYFFAGIKTSKKDRQSSGKDTIFKAFLGLPV